MNEKVDEVKLANAIMSVGMVPGIFRGPKRWAWALEKARALAERMAAPETEAKP